MANTKGFLVQLIDQHESLKQLSKSDIEYLEGFIIESEEILEKVGMKFQFDFIDPVKPSLNAEIKNEELSSEVSNPNPKIEEIKSQTEISSRNISMETNDKTSPLPGSKVDKTSHNKTKGTQTAVSKDIILPNGKVGVNYIYQIPLEQYGLKDIAVQGIFGLEEAGLTFDLESSTITGTPCKSGDLDFTLSFIFTGIVGESKTMERKLKIYVNPDPKTLWKDLPSERSDPYWKSDSDSCFFKTETNALVAASQRGRSHAHEGKFRDDDFRLSVTGNGWNILTVADGAGSAKFSRWGSKIACEQVIEYLTITNPLDTNSSLEQAIIKYNSSRTPKNLQSLVDSLWHSMADAVFESKKKIKEESDFKGASMRDYYTTMMLALCKKFEFGYFIAGFGIGDGGIGIYKENLFVKPLNVPDGGEYAGQTRFITEDATVWNSEGLAKRIMFEFVEDFTGLVLMTDGISDPWFVTDNNIADKDKWDGFWKALSLNVKFNKDNPDIEKQLLKWLDFWSDGNHDDRTVAILF